MDPSSNAALADVLAEAIEDAVLVVDGAGNPVFSSRAALEMLATPDAVCLESLLERVHVDDRAGARALLSRPASEPKRLRIRIPRSDLPSRLLELSVRPSPLGTLARLRDVVLPEEGASDALDRIASHLRDVLWLVDVRHEKLLYVSPAYESVFRRARETLQTGPHAFYEAVHEEDRERLQKAALEGLETGFTEEFRICLPEGGIRWVRHRSVPIRSSEGGPTLTVGITTDIDDRRAAEAARKEGERRFAVLCGSAFETMSEVDSRSRVVWTSERNGIPFGKPDPEDPRPRTDLVHPDDRDDTMRAFGSAFRERRRVTAEYRAADENGVWRWLETTVHPFQTECGEDRALFVSRDVSQRRELIEKVRDREERFRLLADNAHDLITEHDSRGRVLWANRRAVEAGGYSFKDMVEASPLEHMHPDDRERIGGRIFRLSPDGEGMSVTFRSLHGDGSWHWYEANLRTHRTASGDTRLVSVARDVTDRKETEDRLRESEERHRQLVEQSPEAIVVHAEGRVLYANPAALRLVGTTALDPLLGTSVADLLAPDTRESAPRPPERRRGGRSLEGPREFGVRRLDGGSREVMGSHSAIRFDGRAATQTVLHDVTERRRAERERERLLVQLQEARKLESLGVLAGGIAHDFNNLLAVMLGNVNFARRGWCGDEETAAALQDTLEAGESAARLTRQLLAYAGRRAPEVRPVDLSEHVRSIQGLLEAAIPKKVELRFELAESLPVARADVVQLEQVTMNLVRNAAEAIGENEGCVTVLTGAVRIDASTPRDSAAGDDLAPGNYPYLEVRDDGAGMDEDTRRRIFDPFFTTKKTGHGLGLSTVLGLVRGHGGGIELTSEPGHGTAIRIHLPASEAVDRPAKKTPEIVAPVGATVLVADDEPGLRRMLRRILESQGCEVLEAEDGVEAVRIWRERSEDVDIVILDLNMPRAGGEEALMQLRELAAELPVLLSSGDDQSLLADRVSGDPHTAFISKPYLEPELLERIHSLLRR